MIHLTLMHKFNYTKPRKAIKPRGTDPTTCLDGLTFNKIVARRGIFWHNAVCNDAARLPGSVNLDDITADLWQHWFYADFLVLPFSQISLSLLNHWLLSLFWHIRPSSLNTVVKGHECVWVWWNVICEWVRVCFWSDKCTNLLIGLQKGLILVYWHIPMSF